MRFLATLQIPAVYFRSLQPLRLLKGLDNSEFFCRSCIGRESLARELWGGDVRSSHSFKVLKTASQQCGQPMTSYPWWRATILNSQPRQLMKWNLPIGRNRRKQIKRLGGGFKYIEKFWNGLLEGVVSRFFLDRCAKQNVFFFCGVWMGHWTLWYLEDSWFYKIKIL